MLNQAAKDSSTGASTRIGVREHLNQSNVSSAGVTGASRTIEVHHGSSGEGSDRGACLVPVIPAVEVVAADGRPLCLLFFVTTLQSRSSMALDAFLVPTGVARTGSDGVAPNSKV
ncbi:PTS system fructose subfamily IIC subunit [Striga asiatica]|uniref:PTS system fructose subfamily IIC subunit n=1 Tax=Striga asiatica TaxID=4170 RepID=A0A5A7PK10_STRAF|nr:PTS system fructose subfamily IIC subunit [Striga asiatica]